MLAGTVDSLDLSNVENIDDVGLTFLGKGCPKLKFLSLLNNTRVSDKGMVNLSKVSVKLSQTCHFSYLIHLT